MFERFTDPARRVVVLAQEDARERGDDTIRSEHLLLGVCRATDTRGAALLAARGVTLRVVEDDLRRSVVSDRDALASVGIDLDEVRERVEDTFGPGALENTRAAGMRRRRRWGHIPFDRGAKKVLELALREAIRRGDRTIGTEHVLLGMLHRETGRASTLLHARGVSLREVRSAVDVWPSAM
ncbi:Clp protease N-terminal domain-containing protein [Actinomycetospora lemnae]|uniref:Clp protease N-terminal domain-containing protein n=1 Tax=Actinomycetospora lemnae TaxID=3019891 RepID=A0ABT5SNR1_9PSEU|nr:Clp protease N-terminal domain-containing protein [Actinomycetospora sp. DW7H6]MDD7964468.1 Clp protease N-terminal domain-containing protein [Actinomycetospora sp. DW7H6]